MVWLDIGGGNIIVPSFVYFLGFSQKQAQGTSLGILLLPIGILTIMRYYRQGYINPQFVLPIAVGFIIGSFFGSMLATTSLSDEKLRKIFGIALLLIAIKMLFFDRRHLEP